MSEEPRAKARRDERLLAPSSPAPFVVGVARSGTTLLRLMLDAHPDLAIPPETHFIPLLARGCGPDGGPGERDPGGRDCVLAILRSDPRWSDFGVDASELARRMDELDSFTSFTLGGALRAFYELYAARFGKPRWGDKTPRYLVYQPLIRRLLPEARFVHLIRDGRDVWLSQREMRFGPDTVDAAAAAWVARIAQARKQAATDPRYLEVRYEDLVLEPEATLRRVCGFIELPWDSVMLAYYERAEDRLAELHDVANLATGRTRKGVDRQRIHALTAAPPDAGRLGRWRRELDRSDQETYEATAGPLLRELGYESG